MISYLNGILKNVGENTATILVGGVGYEVNIPNSLSSKFSLDKEVEVFVYTHVREEILALYGFSSPEELVFFKLLISVSGIGPKVALSILSTGNIEKLKESISKGDATLLSTVSGVGKKTAEKAVVELKNKVGGINQGPALSGDSVDVLEALTGLGFQKAEAAIAIAKIPQEADTSEEKIKEALKILGK